MLNGSMRQGDVSVRPHLLVLVGKLFLQSSDHGFLLLPAGLRVVLIANLLVSIQARRVQSYWEHLTLKANPK